MIVNVGIAWYSIWTMSGAPADLTNLHQNERVIVEISGTVPIGVRRQMGVIDLLPAGLEIEQPLKGDDAKTYSFLANLIDTVPRPFEKESMEKRQAFHVAYIARAVSVGHFALPAASVEDMYAPAVRARTAMSELVINAAGNAMVDPQ